MNYIIELPKRSLGTKNLSPKQNTIFSHKIISSEELPTGKIREKIIEIYKKKYKNILEKII